MEKTYELRELIKESKPHEEILNKLVEVQKEFEITENEKQDLKEINERQRIRLADRDKEIARLRRVIHAAISNDDYDYFN